MNSSIRTSYRKVGGFFRSLQAFTGSRYLLSVLVVLYLPVLASESGQTPEDGKVQSSPADRYYEYIEQLEAEGAYDDRLAEPLFGLGRLFQEQQNFNEAAKLLTRALHLKRVNDGLYSESQIPILQTLINTHVKSRQWRSVDRNYAYLESLYRNLVKNNRRSVETYIAALEQASRWHLAAVSLDVDENNIEHLKRVRDIHEKIVEAAAQEYGENDVKLVPHLYHLALAHYYFGAGMLPREIASATRYQPGGLFGDRDRTVSVNFQINRSVSKGLDILNRIKSIYANAGDVEAEAMAVLYLADWALLLDDARRIESRMRYYVNSGVGSRLRHDVRSARSFAPSRLKDGALQNYHYAYSKLLASGAGKASLDHFFSNVAILPIEQFNASLADATPRRPVKKLGHIVAGDTKIGGGENPNTEIPVLAEFVSWSPYMSGVDFPRESVEAFIPVPPQKHGVAEFRVGANGRANGVRIIESESEGLNTHVVRKEIESIQFRPRINLNKAPDSEVVHLHYVSNE